MRTYAAEGCGRDETITAWVWGQRSMPFPWIVCRSAFTTGKACSRNWQADMHVWVFTWLGSSTNTLGEHQPNWDLATPISLLWAVKLWYILPTLLHSPDGRINRRQRFALLESGDKVLLLVWLMAHTRRGDTRQIAAAQEARKRRSSNAGRRRVVTGEG